MRAVLLIFALTLLVAAVGLTASRVHQLESGELEHETDWQRLRDREGKPGATRISVRLAEVALQAGEQVTLELCARGSLAQLAGAIDLAVWLPQSQSLELKVPLDQANLARVRERGGKSCLELGGGRLARSGMYAIDAVWAGKPRPSEAHKALPLQVRVLATHPIGTGEKLLVLAAAAGSMLLTLAAFTPIGRGDPRPRAPEGARAASESVRGVSLALLFGGGNLLAFMAVVSLPLAGASGGLLRGLLLAGIECALAVVGAYYALDAVRSGLSLHAPARRPGAWLLLAAGCGLMLRPVPRLAMQLIPSSFEAPIEAFVAWPSGALSFALLGMTVPIAEELFFRGLIYGSLRPLGRPLAVAGTLLLFSAAHAQQTWGNWGALVAVTLTGLVLTLLRAWSGSTLVPMVAHLLYNLSLWAVG